MVELWSGVGSVVAAAERRGLVGQAMDILLTSDHDMRTRRGFGLALACVLALPPAGLLVMAPDCSSFVFPNSSRCQRKKHCCAGNEGYGPVRAGNDMACEAAFLLAVAAARGLFVALENPSGSSMFRFLRPWLRVVPGGLACIAHRCAYADEPAGHRWFKPYKFLGHGPQGKDAWIEKAMRRCHCPSQKHVPLMKKSASGVSGTPGLSKSGHYPKRLGELLVSAWLQARARVQEEDEDSYTSYSESSVSDSEPEESLMNSSSSGAEGNSPDAFQPGSW